MSRTLSLAVAVGAATVLSGCGSDHSSSAPSSTAVPATLDPVAQLSPAQACLFGTRLIDMNADLTLAGQAITANHIQSAASWLWLEDQMKQVRDSEKALTAQLEDKPARVMDKIIAEQERQLEELKTAEPGAGSAVAGSILVLAKQYELDCNIAPPVSSDAPTPLPGG